MASPPSPSAASAPASPTKSSRQNTTFYSIVMTPVYFVGFLFSLLLIDLRYTLARAYRHPDVTSRLPVWLHQLIYRPQPYQHLRPGQGGGGWRWHYHSNQRKLMKMEAAEAFRIRSAVLVALVVIAAVVTGGLYYLANRLYHDVLVATWVLLLNV